MIHAKTTTNNNLCLSITIFEEFIRPFLFLIFMNVNLDLARFIVQADFSLPLFPHLPLLSLVTSLTKHGLHESSASVKM